MNNRADWAIAQEEHWYRIPVEQVEKLKQRQKWAPPQWLAFYQTKEFEQDAYTIQSFARVQFIQVASRQELFPEEFDQAKGQKQYYKITIEPMQRLMQPIRSDRLRRLTFIATTFEKLLRSQEINEL